MGAPRRAAFGFRELARLVFSAFEPLLSHTLGVGFEDGAVSATAELPGPGPRFTFAASFRIFLVDPLLLSLSDGSSSKAIVAAVKKIEEQD